MNFIPCATWVRRGIAAAKPEKVELEPNELEKIIKEMQSELQEVEDEEASASGLQQTEKESDEYNFKSYDNESDNIYCHIGNVATFGEDGKDPLITNDDEDSDEEDEIIKSDDNLLLVGHMMGANQSVLEVFLYNENEESFYCHHDILLSHIPMCIEWLNYDNSYSKPGNLCAIGTMSPIIEIWDLDFINCVKPAYKLGCKGKKKKRKPVGHKDAVLDVAWNENYSHILASGSVDQTVLLWDLENRNPVIKFDQFDDKVQTLKWHPTETHQLLTGSTDKSIRLFDCKTEQIARCWNVMGEVEKVLWNNYQPNYCIASTDNGYIVYFDIRADKPLWEVKAHEKDVTGLSLSATWPGLLVSASYDGVIKIWDILDHNLNLIWEKEENLGNIHCLAANPNNGFIFTAGGDNAMQNLKLLNFSEIPAVREKFINAKSTALSSSARVENMDIEDMN